MIFRAILYGAIVGAVAYLAHFETVAVTMAAVSAAFGYAIGWRDRGTQP